MFHRHGAEAARAAHNREVTRSKRVAGIFQFAGLQNLPRCHHSTPFHRHGAEVARGAHNSEVTRSKRVAGIFQFAVSRTASLSLQHPYSPEWRRG